MSAKRGRPVSEDTLDTAVLRRRQETARRVREHRQRRQAAQPASAPPTADQLQQGEQIISLAFTHEDAAETLAQLGLRVQGVTVAQDAGAARVQQGAIAVDEHDQLYRAADRSPPPPLAERPRLDQGPSGPVAPPASRGPA
jgi:hypothetical protein